VSETGDKAPLVFLSYTESDRDHVASLSTLWATLDLGDLEVWWPRPETDLLEILDRAEQLIGQLKSKPDQDGWTSQFRKALAEPELTDQQKSDLVASMILALMVFLFMASQQYSQLADRIQLIDSLTGIGVLLFGLYLIRNRPK
jgi:hypothetical protein